MRLIKSAIVGLGGVAVIAASLAAPPASANTKPQTRSPQPAVTSVVSKTTATPAEKSGSSCEPLGHKREDDTDCVTVRVASEVWVEKIGEDVALRGKVHSSIQLPPGTRVVIQRATDGGAWDDKGEKWRKVATAKVREDGSFRKNVVLHRAGLHTFRAKLVTTASSRAAAQPAIAMTRTVAARDNATPDLAVSATASATAGTAYYVYEFHNQTGHDLNIACQGFRQNQDGSISQSPSTAYVNIPQNGSPISCAYPMAPGARGTDSLAASFSLQQANPIIGAGSIYSFNPSNSLAGKACADRQPRIKPGDAIRVDLTPADWENLGMGYTGTMNFPSDPSQPMCDFIMATGLQNTLWTGAPTWLKTIEGIAGFFAIMFAAFVGAIYIAGLATAATAVIIAVGAAAAIALVTAEVMSSYEDTCMSINTSCTSNTGVKYGVVKIPAAN